MWGDGVEGMVLMGGLTIDTENFFAVFADKKTLECAMTEGFSEVASASSAFVDCLITGEAEGFLALRAYETPKCTRALLTHHLLR